MLRYGKGRLLLGLGTTLMFQMATDFAAADQRCAPRYAPATPSYCPPAVGPHTPPVEPAVPSGEKPMDPNVGPVPPAADGNNGNQINPDNLFNNQNQVQNQAFNPNAQAQNTTLASRSSIAPNMVGDLFGTGHPYTGLVGGIDPISSLPSGGNLGAAPGASVGRMKLTENTSPIPRDRVFVNYSFFNNTPVGAGGQDVSRITPGIEKTFLDGNASIEVRTPFAATLDSTSVSGAAGTIVDTNNAEFGNMTIYLKGLLFDTETFALSAGLGVALPTAKDVRVYDPAGTMLVNVQNQSTHLLPFLGALYTPNERLFVQSMLQFDFDTTGNLASINNGALVTTAHDANYVFVSASTGYWVYLNHFATGHQISGIAPIAELHYNGNMTSATQINSGGNVFIPSDIQLLNGLVGVNARFGCGTNLTVAYCAPLTGGSQQFDGELRVMFNWFFGPSGGSTGTRATRAQF